MEEKEPIEQPQDAEILIDAEAEEKDESVNSGSFGKFKDAKSLLKAYNSLEAEFTRRNQRLKELEGICTSATEKTEPVPEAPQGEETKISTYEEFFTKYPQAVKYAGAILKEAAENRGKRLDEIYINILAKENIFNADMLSDEQFLDKYIYTNQRIKDYFITDYLKNIDEALPKVKLLGGNGGAPAAAPPYRPKTLEEAALLAKEIIKKK